MGRSALALTAGHLLMSKLAPPPPDAPITQRNGRDPWRGIAADLGVRGAAAPPALTRSSAPARNTSAAGDNRSEPARSIRTSGCNVFAFPPADKGAAAAARTGVYS